MGWLFTEGRTKAELITHLTEGDSKIRTHRKCVRGSTLWAVQENTDYPGLFIIAYLLRRERGYGWGYKPVSESMGPAELSCPVGYLDAVPVADSAYAQPWRDRVRQRQAENNRRRNAVANASPGDRIILPDGAVHQTLALVSKKPLIGMADDGSHWRVPQRFVQSITPASESAA